MRILLLIFVLGLTGINSVMAQHTFRTTPKNVIPYLEYLPSDYSGNSNKYPVVIFLHGIGERGPNTTDLSELKTAIAAVEKHGPPKHVKNGTSFPFILISPQLKNNYGTWPTWYVMELIDHVKTYLRIDERRIHISGLSLGGGGTWTMAQDYPELFASVSAICGGYNAPSKACNLVAENLPVWAFHGDADTTVPLSRSENMVNAINACTPSPDPLAILSVYPGVKHNAWDYAYRPDHTQHNPNVYEWMMSYTNVVNNGNRIPVANAGSDKTATESTFTLKGSGTDSDGTISGYAWKKISGPACTLANATTASLSVSGLTTGTYVFRLTVKDNVGDTDSDYVRLIIQKAPLANAGPDVTVTLPTSKVTIKGSGTDADGSISSYKWSFVSGPKTPAFSTTTSESTTVSGLTEPGKYVLGLEVKDNQGGIGKDQMTITVTGSAEAANTPPVANAGKDVTITLPVTSTNLVGGGTDADGSVTAYKWSFLSGPAVPVLTNTTAQKVSISGLSTVGKYTFRLEVRDNSNATASDEVVVTVLNSPENAQPVVYAGDDVELFLPETTVTIAGSASDEDGKIVSYQWDQTAGPETATLDGATTATLRASKLTREGTYTFRLTAKDDAGATAHDEMSVIVRSKGNTQAESPDEGEFRGGEVVDLSETSTDYWDNKLVIIYTETGSRIFQGKWTADNYAAILRRPGLIIYAVMDGDQRLRTGKLWITP